MDKQNTQQILSAAVVRILRPLVKILLRNGIAYGNFAELARKVYVDVAFEDNSGKKKPTISSVSALTGLTRKETKRLVELSLSDNNTDDQRYNRATRVIGGWLNDERFLDRSGQPALLHTDETPPSFVELIKIYSGDIPPQAMLSVLKLAECVEEVDQSLRLVKHAFIPGNDDVDKLNILGKDVSELISTIEHNLSHPPDDAYFQRKVSSHQLKLEKMSEFQKLSAKKSQALLEELDQWLSQQEVERPEDPACYVALGIHYIDSRLTPGEQDEQD